MDLSKLEALKTMIAAEKDLSTPFNYFFDHFGENETFLEKSVPTSSGTAMMFIAAAAMQWFGKQIKPERLMLLTVPGTQFIHGGFVLNKHVCNIICFEEIQTAIICMAKSPTSTTQFARFSARMMPKDFASEN